MTQNSSLLVKTKIYKNETFELVDYDSSEIIINKLEINQSGVLVRSNQNTYFRKTEIIQNDEVKLIKIAKDPQNDCFFINSGKYTNNLYKLVDHDAAYLVYKTPFYEEDQNKKNKRSYKLSEGDIIKLGRVYIKILEINLSKKKIEQDNESKNSLNINKNINCTSFRKNSSFNSFMIKGQEVIKGSCSNLGLIENDDEQSNEEVIVLNNDYLKRKKLFDKKLILPKVTSSKDLFSFRKENKIKLKPKKSIKIIIEKYKNVHKNKNKKICRVCYGEDEPETNNPLINPCICKGSMKYIHYKCLKNWLDKKIESSPLSSIEIRDGIGMSYCTDDLICELCKTKFPDMINYNGKLYNLSFYKTTFEKYLIFESMQIENNKKKFIHILSFDKTNKLLLGRSEECDISFPELSVSRHHCFIYYDKDSENLYLDDNSSRFGSLILIQNQFLLVLNNLTLNIQKCKTYIKIKLTLPFNLCSCCNVSNRNDNIKSYQQQNAEYLDAFNCLEIKNNYIDSENENEKEENENNKEDNIININIRKNRRKSLKLFSYDNKKPDNNFVSSAIKMKSLDYMKKKINNMKNNKKRFKNDINVNLLRNEDNKNHNFNKKADIHRLFNINRFNFNSFDEGNKNNINRLNINNRNLFIRNYNLLSLNINSNKKKNNFKRKICLRKEAKNINNIQNNNE